MPLFENSFAATPISDDLKVNDIVQVGSRKTLFRVIDAKSRLLFSESCIDSIQFNSKSNNWGSSSINAWLNNAFYNTFSEIEKGAISTTSYYAKNELNNGDSTLYTTKVRLLGYSDLRSYIFPTNNLSSDKRVRNTEGKPKRYWTLTPDSKWPDSVYVVGNDGEIYTNKVGQQNYWICPALNLNSGIFLTGLGTSTNPYVISSIIPSPTPTQTPSPSHSVNPTIMPTPTNTPNWTQTPQSSPVSLTLDTIAPTLTTVSIYSNNSINNAQSNVGDTISLSIKANETLASTPSVTILGRPAIVLGAGNSTYIATLVTSETDSNGTVPFSIIFKDVAGNVGNVVTTTTDLSKVTVFNSPQATSQPNTASTSTNGSTSSNLTNVSSDVYSDEILNTTSDLTLDSNHTIVKVDESKLSTNIKEIVAKENEDSPSSTDQTQVDVDLKNIQAKNIDVVFSGNNIKEISDKNLNLSVSTVDTKIILDVTTLKKDIVSQNPQEVIITKAFSEDPEITST